MKRRIRMKSLVVLLAILILTAPAFSATVEVLETGSEVVNLNPEETMVWFDITTIVAAGATQLFKLRIPISKGYIRDATWNSASDNCTIGFYESEALATAADIPRLEFTVDTYKYSPDTRKRSFANRDDAKCIYMRLYNGAGAISTGAGTDNATSVILTVGEQKR